MEIAAILIRWYLAVQLVAFLCWPAAFQLFKALPDRGYSVSKSAAVLILGLLSWLGASYLLLPRNGGSLWGLVAALGLVSAVWRLSNRRPSPHSRSLDWLWANGKLAVIIEALFLAGFLGWAVIRSTAPAISHTEQPMDFAFLSSISASPDFPPQDPWLAGYPISYYYLGYWLLAALGDLARTPPEITYNAGQALWFGLLVTGCFGVGFNLAASPFQTTRPLRDGILTGFLAAIWVALCGNLLGPLEWLYARGWLPEGWAAWWGVHGFPTEARVTGDWLVGSDWWWWRSSRVIADQGVAGEHLEVITEFPFFSFFLGDNHPHLLSMPFVTLLVALLLNRYFSSLAFSRSELNRPVAPSGALAGPAEYGIWLPAMICLGAVSLINVWDLAGCLLLMALVFGLSRLVYPTAPTLRSRDLVHLLPLGVAFLMLTWPFLVTLQGAVTGVSLNYINPTRLRQSLLMFGSFLPAAVAFLLLPHTRISRRLRSTSQLFLVFCLVPLVTALVGAMIRFEPPLRTLAVTRWVSSPFTAICAAALLSAIAVRVFRRDAGKSPSGPATGPSLEFAGLLSGVGWLLVLLPEFIYVMDPFGTRMNTVFKLYYLGWLFLGLGGSVVVFASVGSRGFAARVAGLLSLLLVCGGLIYPVLTISGTFATAGPVRSLDGLGFLALNSPDERNAIDWIRANTEPGARILEAVGESYRPDLNRFSSATGRATLLGWAGHEVQWRGRSFGEFVAGRSEAAEVVYSTGQIEQVASAIAEWKIDYVVLSPAERSQYRIGSEREQLLATALDEVFHSGTVTVFRRRDWARAERTFTGP